MSSTTPKQILTLDPPRNQTARLLRDLIRGKEISEQDYRMNGFRTRLSELNLRHRLPIRSIRQEFVNNYGHTGYFKKHFILSIHTDRAVKLYRKINSG